MTVQRYSPGFYKPYPICDGTYVLHSDFAALQAKLEDAEVVSRHRYAAVEELQISLREANEQRVKMLEFCKKLLATYYRYREALEEIKAGEATENGATYCLSYEDIHSIASAVLLQEKP